jgi:hypothetical protein
VLPTLANTLRRIQADPNDFYMGSLAQDIVQDIQEAGTRSNCFKYLFIDAFIHLPSFTSMSCGCSALYVYCLNTRLHTLYNTITLVYC